MMRNGANTPDEESSRDTSVDHARQQEAVAHPKKAELRSLAPAYDKEKHASYVEHLEAAVRDPRNKNIALTGRYGSGKSSILDRFIENQEAANEENPETSSHQPQKILRISINTLGNDDDEHLANRIQKELVKQLVYRAAPGEIKHSRFARTRELTPQRAVGEAFVVTIILCGTLWLFGLRPESGVFGDADELWSMLMFALIVLAATSAGRWVLGNRGVSQFSTSGTSISFDKKTDSYFDEYLDEIMAFFEETEPDIVVFEDLDRFDEPQIFDSLRELNTLINTSAHWMKRKDRPLRFVYAIKDSLFERLGKDQQTGGDETEEPSDEDNSRATSRAPESDGSLTVNDKARSAVERANRTKFFEIVIPVVPFLSHSNARDLLSKELKKSLPENTSISRELLDLVARNATDMRLLINICNEFVVFAQRLLWVERPAPGMEPDDLFALVVYKNFHPADFEALPHRGSALDVLEGKRQELVRFSIDTLQNRRRDLHRVNELQHKQDTIADNLGERLKALLSVMPGELQQLVIGEQSYKIADAQRRGFWERAAQAQALSAEFQVPQRGFSGATVKKTVDLESAHLKTLFPDGLDPNQWREPEPEELHRQRAQIDADIAELRGADYKALAQDPRFTFEESTFDRHIERTLHSDLARQLVRRGFINRYYAEYSATFYGDFLGVDVANFFRNSVWPNEMLVDFEFTTPDAVSNVLQQAPEGFASSRSALNVQVVNYMLENEPALARDLSAFVAAEQGDDPRVFLKAFFNEPSVRKTDLVCFLAEHPWRGLFDRLALPDTVSDEETRSSLLDAALRNARDAASYRFGTQVTDLIAERHSTLTAFTKEHGPKRTNVMFSITKTLDLRVPALEPIAKGLRKLLIDEHLYVLTAENLRVALSLNNNDPVALDEVRISDPVWQRIQQDPDTYFGVVEEDPVTPYVVQSAETLHEVLIDQHEGWSSDQINTVLRSSAPEATLPTISKLPEATWPSVAAARRMSPSPANLLTYSNERGFDRNLAQVLLAGEDDLPVEMENLEATDAELLQELLVLILNAATFLSPKVRVSLALQIIPEPQPDELPVAEVEPQEDDLLAELLEAGLVPDTAETFEHFATAGWGAVARAFEVSEKAAEFLSPELVGGHAAELLRKPRVPVKTKMRILNELKTFVEDDDSEGLKEAGGLAHAKEMSLPLAEVERIAPYASEAQHVVWQLAQLGQEISSDDVIRILGKLDDGFEGFNQASGHEFDVPRTESITSLLERLRNEGLVELPRGGKRHRKKVKLV
ncbi:TniB family NTP-binding protein [Nesterenkonia populi]|uniref:YobI family P-loop NTPase n=1 Tax=Nesterenkonia populi TaxID=1591087 RepID=UPI0011BEAC14|nr:TniB family NTP-binding protein [Nesterenkonia populi]